MLGLGRAPKYAGETTMERLERFRSNERENRQTMLDAGIRLQRPKFLYCQRCRLLEDAIFWTPRKQSGRTLQLECPSCGRRSVRYTLPRADDADEAAGGDRIRLASALPAACIVSLVVAGLAIGGTAGGSLDAVAPLVSRWQGMAAPASVGGGIGALGRGAAARGGRAGSAFSSGAEAILLGRRGDRREAVASRLEDEEIASEYDASSDLTLLKVPRDRVQVADSLVAQGWLRM